jgi:glutaredoxin-related protein
MATEPESYYLLHVSDTCPWCLRAKALLEYYGAAYRTTVEPCDEWPTLPAIYKVGSDSKDLIGGYDQLCALSFEEGL